MKILALTFFFPFPPNNGSKLRELSILKPLARSHSVSLCSMIEGDEYQYIESATKLFDEVKVFPRPQIKTSRYKFFKLFSSLKPDVFFDAYSRDLKNYIKQVTLEKKFDVVLVDLLWMMMYLPKHVFKKSYVILNEHNVEFKALESYISPSVGRKRNLQEKVNFRLQAFKMKRLERYYCNKADMTLVVSEVDKRALAKICPKAAICVIPNAIDTEHIKVKGLSGRQNWLVFIGSMFYLPNIDAMLYFCKDIFPLVREKIPSIKLYIVGKDPSQEIKALNNGKDIVVTGHVKDHRHYLDCASCVVAPIRLGGGTKMKVIEAMAAGKTVVTTPKGIEGLNVIAGEEILIGYNSRDFAEKVSLVLEDDMLRKKISLNARRRIEKNYSWEVVDRKILQLVSGIQKQLGYE